MVRYTIPSTILAMAIGAMGSEMTALRNKGPVLSSDGPIKGREQTVTGGLKHRGGVSKGNADRAADDEPEVADLTSSIDGTYAIVMEDGHNQGSGLGLVTYDGDGNFSGNLAVNGPDPEFPPGVAPATRRFFTTPIQGYYEPDEIEEGIFFEHLEYDESPLGPLEFHVRLMIAEKTGSNAVVVLGSHLEPSPFVPASLIKFEMTPHRGSGFDNASMQGQYALHLRGGMPLEGNGYGHMRFYGDGNFHGFMYGNGPIDEVERTAFGTGLAGSYSVNDDGTGFQELEFTGPGFQFRVDFLILEYNGSHATRVRAQLQDPSPRTHNLVVFDLTYTGP